jgi:hypothetical protein
MGTVSTASEAGFNTDDEDKPNPSEEDENPSGLKRGAATMP